MKQILYDIANQIKVNKDVHSKGRREKGLGVTSEEKKTVYLKTLST